MSLEFFFCFWMYLYAWDFWSHVSFIWEKWILRKMRKGSNTVQYFCTVATQEEE